MIFIKKEKNNSLDKIIDCDNLSESYLPLISDNSIYQFSYWAILNVHMVLVENSPLSGSNPIAGQYPITVYRAMHLSQN